MSKSNTLEKQTKIEQTVMDGYKANLIHEGETLEEAKALLRAEQQTRRERYE